MNAAEALGLSREFGAVRETFRADFVIVAGDPRDATVGLARLRTPVGVVRAGRWVDSLALAGLR